MLPRNVTKWIIIAACGMAIIAANSIVINGATDDDQALFDKTLRQAEKLEKKSDLTGAIEHYQTLLDKLNDEELKQRVLQRLLQVETRLRIINAVVKHIQESGGIKLTKTGRRGLEGTVIAADPKRFTLKHEGAQMKLPWTRLRGRSLYDLGTKAMDMYTGQAHFDLAMLCLSQDLPDLAEQEFEKAVSLEPSLEEAAAPYRRPADDAAAETDAPEEVASALPDDEDTTDDEDEDETDNDETDEEPASVEDFGWKESSGNWTVDKNGFIEGTGAYGMITAGNSDWRNYQFSFTGQLVEGAEMLIYARGEKRILRYGWRSPGFAVVISNKQVYTRAAWRDGGYIWWWYGSDAKRSFKGGKVHKYTVKVKGNNFKVYADGKNIAVKGESRIKTGVAGIGFTDGTIKIRDLKIRRLK